MVVVATHILFRESADDRSFHFGILWPKELGQTRGGGRESSRSAIKCLTVVTKRHCRTSRILRVLPDLSLNLSHLAVFLMTSKMWAKYPSYLGKHPTNVPNERERSEREDLSNWVSSPQSSLPCLSCLRWKCRDFYTACRGTRVGDVRFLYSRPVTPILEYFPVVRHHAADKLQFPF